MIRDRFSLDGKVAIVTGSGTGIGKGIALGFAEFGADVVVAARTAANIEQTASEVRKIGRKTIAVPTDVRVAEQVTNLINSTVNEFGRIDILVNNAGGSFISLLVNLSEGGWDAQIRENLKSCFLCSKAAAEVMVKQKSGCIINISSNAGSLASPGLAAYAAAKAGINSLTKTSAME
jgi:NAD(P)-dependent dehydrogenase (short-subunit alcohol dehydrogenase family)